MQRNTKHRNPSKRIFRKRQIIVPLMILGMNFTSIRSGSHQGEENERPYLRSKPIQQAFSKKDLHRLSDHISRTNPGLTEKEAKHLAKTILIHSTRLAFLDHMIIDGRRVNPAHYLAAMIQVESSFIYNAVSSSDARGFMQIKPSTADHIDAMNGQSGSRDKLFHGPTNIRMGVDYINYLVVELSDIRQVTLAYNAGPGAVKQGQFKPEYWSRVLRAYRQLEQRSFLDRSGVMIADSMN